MLTTREEVIELFEKRLEEMSEDQRDLIFIACACGNHAYSPRSLIEVMKDPDNEDGQLFIKHALLLERSSDEDD